MAEGLVISDVSYAGTFASYFWLPATFGMDTVQKGVVYVQDGIKKKHTIGRIDMANPLQPRAATPTSSGTFTVDGRILTPLDLMMYTEFNPRDYEQHWLAEQLSNTLLARELPKTAENYMLQIALNRVFEAIEAILWMGSTTYTAVPGSDGNGQLTYFDGFIKKLLADSGVKQVASPFTLVSTATDGSHTNIGEALNSLLSLTATNKKALLANTKRYERLKFLVSIKTAQIYEDYLTNTTFKNNNTTDKGINQYKGYEIVPLAGMPDDTIVFTTAIAAPDSNLYIGLNSTEDNTLEMKRLQNNSELFYLKGLMKYDVQFGFAAEVFVFTTLTSATFNA